MQKQHRMMDYGFRWQESTHFELLYTGGAMTYMLHMLPFCSSFMNLICF